MNKEESKEFKVVAIFLAILIVWLIYVAIASKKHVEVKPEYIIELKSQDSVYIQTPDTLYMIQPGDIQKTIEQDNL